MSEISTLTSSAAGRYANALFDLAAEDGALDAVESDLKSLDAALGDSDDLSELIRNPIYSRVEQARAMGAVCQALEMGPLSSNVIGLMASKRRLFALPELIDTYSKLMAEHRGEVEAQVAAARPLSEAQMEALSSSISSAVGKNVNLKVTVDESLIGGLVVKVGSRMIDSSLRAKLTGLQTAMKEVG